MRKKGIKLGAAVIMLAVLLMGCGATALSENFDEDTVKTTAKQIVTCAGDGDYEAITDMVQEEYQESLSTDTIEEAFAPVLEEAGTFDSYKSETVVGVEDKNYDGELAMAVLAAKYEDKTVTYTITLNTDYEIVGLYIK